MSAQINIRILEDLKSKAYFKAKQEGTSISALVSQFLKSYVNGEVELRIVQKKTSSFQPIGID